MNLFFYKNRRKNDFLNYFQSYVKGNKNFEIYCDSSRELSLKLFFLHILKLIFKFNIVILLTSYPSSAKSSISLRKPISKFSVMVSKLLFPNNLMYYNRSYYGFYDVKIVLFLFLLRNNNFNPWFEGCSPFIDLVISRYPLQKNHSDCLSRYKVDIIYKGEFFENSLKVYKKTKNVLFAMPQFFEQGLMSKKKSDKLILKMLKFIKNKEGVFPDIILHPRMKKRDYLKYSSNLFQHNLKELLPNYKKYYTINSSTIFLACSYKCDCYIFKLNILDYSFLDVLNKKFSINYIKI